jgi:hypothetical protein
VDDPAEVMALVGVDAAEEHQNPEITDRHREHLTEMTVGTRGVEPGQIGHLDAGRGGSQGVYRRAPTRSEDDGDVVAGDSGALGDRRGRPLGVWTHGRSA